MFQSGTVSLRVETMEKATQQDFSQIYVNYHDKLLRYLTRMVGEDEAEEVCQVVFEKCSMNLKSFKGQSKLSTWLFRIATNAALDTLKSTSFRHSCSGPLAPLPIHSPTTEASASSLRGELATPDESVIKEEMNSCIREFVDRLPDQYRTIIILNELEGFTNKEIAELLDISLGSAKIRLHRARVKLRSTLEMGCDFYLDDRSELACDRKQPAQ